MRGRGPGLARIDRALVVMIDQIGLGDHFGRNAAARLEREGFRCEQSLGFGILQAGVDALDRRVGVEGQPGGAGFGDGDL